MEENFELRFNYMAQNYNQLENCLDSIDENLIRHFSKNDFMEENFNVQFA